MVRLTSFEIDRIWVWRSLVACLNGVQEAGGSNPLTQTIAGGLIAFERCYKTARFFALTLISRLPAPRLVRSLRIHTKRLNLWGLAAFAFSKAHNSLSFSKDACRSGPWRRVPPGRWALGGQRSFRRLESRRVIAKLRSKHARRRWGDILV